MNLLLLAMRKRANDETTVGVVWHGCCMLENGRGAPCLQVADVVTVVCSGARLCTAQSPSGQCWAVPDTCPALLSPLPCSQAGSEAQQQPQENGAAHSSQAAPGAKAARRSVDGAEASPGAAAKAKAARTPAAAVQAKDPSWADQRYTDPDLDYGEG